MALKSADFDKNRLGNMAIRNHHGITLHLKYNLSRQQIDPLKVSISWSIITIKLSVKRYYSRLASNFFVFYGKFCIRIDLFARLKQAKVKKSEKNRKYFMPVFHVIVYR